MREIYDTDIKELTVRFVKEGEEGLILEFIKEISVYEKMQECVVATKESIRKAIFDLHSCNALVVEYKNEPVGFCIFFYSFSTFCGRTNIYLEDLFVKEKFRGRGFGKEVFKVLVQITLEEGCHRLEWVCLNWNKSSIEFYKKMGAFALEDFTTWRMTRKEMSEMLH